MLPTAITSLDAEAIDLPLTEPFAIATGAQAVAEIVLVRLQLADGTVGLGEAAPFFAVSGETREGALAAVLSAGPPIVGRDARAWRKLAADLAEALPGEPAARCGIEMALLDAVGRSARLPLWALFGGAGTRLVTDCTIPAGDVEHADRSARSLAARGFDAIKVKVGALDPEADAERLAAVHRAAPAATLLADANGGWDAARSLAFLAALERRAVPLALFEQPVARERPDELASVARASRVPVAADESARSAGDVLALARDGAVRAVNLKLMKTGLAEALAMWSIARAAGMSLMIGGMVEGPLAMSYSTHFAAGLGGFSYVDLDTHLFVASHPFSGGFAVEGAALDVAGVEAGHGVTLKR